MFDITQPAYKRNNPCYLLSYIILQYLEKHRNKIVILFSDLLAQCPRDMITAYNTLKEAIDRQLKRNKFSCVNLTGIFNSIGTNPAGMFVGVGSQEDFDELGDLSDDTDKEV